MRVTVVVVNWNSGPLLSRCLAALSAQTRRPERVVVVDNGSTDGSCPEDDAARPLRVLRLGTNTGFAAGSNRGIREAGDCEAVALLNPDAFPEPRWLEALLAAAEAHPGHVAFGSRMLAGTPGLLDGIGDAYHVSGRPWRVGHHRAPSEAAEEAEIFSPCAAAALYRRAELLEAGGFDERYFCYVEDVDLGFRLRLRGGRCLYVPEAVVTHVGSATSGAHSDFSLYHGHRNLVWTFFKDMPWPLLVAYLPQHLALNLFTVAWFAARGRAGPLLRAKRDALRGLPAVLRERRRIQAGRRVGAWALRQVMSRGLLRPYLEGLGRREARAGDAAAGAARA